MSHPLPPKKEVALALLERSRVHIHLDPRKDGVTVPAAFRRQPQLVLEIGLNMPVPIPDLRLDEDGMTCTLSFSRQPFYCAIPWTSIFAMVGDDGRGMVWPDDVPPEIAQATVGPQEAQKPRAVPSPAKRAPAQVQAAPAPAQAAPVAQATKGQAAAASAEGSSGVGVGVGAGASEEKPKAKRPSRSKKPRIVAVEAAPPERPVLVALPPPPEPRGPRPVPSEKKRPPPPRARTGKAKRELPPYLRVVK
jgi:stringent starvation protein B